MTTRRFNAVSILDATEGSPTFAGLAARARESSERLAAVQDLIPAEMRAAVRAGPEEGGVWCLLVSSSAAAAKLRHVAPLIESRLKQLGSSATSIRIKLHAPQR